MAGPGGPAACARDPNEEGDTGEPARGGAQVYAPEYAPGESVEIAKRPMKDA